MAKRRQFVGATLGSAFLCLLLWRVFHGTVNVPPEEARALVRVWLAADYRQSAQDPALRPPVDPNAPPTALAAETQPIAFAQFDLARPFIKPRDAAHAALVRAEIRFKGGAPPDDESVRFFLLAQKEGGEWQVRHEISESAFRWRLGW